MKHLSLRHPVVLALLVASVAVHWPPHGAEFSQDDRDFVQVNASIRSLSAAWSALLAPFPPDQPGRALYRPLTNLSYAFDHATWGQSARGYHATNVLLYLAVVLLVHRVALRYLPSPAFALTSALIFSVHPVHCAAVDSVAGRSELLALLFGLASILLHLRALGSRRGGSSLAGSVAFYALACFSKESGAVLPAILFCHAALFHPPRDPGETATRIRVWRSLPAYAAVLALYLALRLVALGRFSPETAVLADAAPLVRLWTMGAVFFEYLRLLLFPRVLQVDFYYHDIVGIPSGPTAQALLGLAALALCVALLSRLGLRHWRGAAAPVAAIDGADGRRQRGVVIIALVIFLAYLTPVLHVLDIGALLAERFLLAPSLGFVLLVVLGGSAGLRRFVPAARRAPLAIAIVATLAVAGTWRSAGRAGEWRDNVRLWQSAVNAIPWDARPYINLAAAHLERGEFAPTENALRRALDIEPTNQSALGNLGLLQLGQGDTAEAIATFRRIVEIEPRDFGSWNNLGVAETQLGNHPEAEKHYARALEINPNYAPARANLLATRRALGSGP